MKRARTVMWWGAMGVAASVTLSGVWGVVGGAGATAGEWTGLVLLHLVIAILVGRATHGAAIQTMVQAVRGRPLPPGAPREARVARRVVQRASEQVDSITEQCQTLESEMRSRAAMEKSLRETQFKMTTIVETAHDAYLALSSEGIVEDVSIRAERLFNRRRRELVGIPFEELVRRDEPRRDEPWADEIARVAWFGGHLEATAHPTEKPSLPVSLSLSTMEFGGLWTINVFLNDISERKQLESQLLHSQKLESIGQLAAGVAHEINTPAQYVSDNTRFLQDAWEDLAELGVQTQALLETVAQKEDPTDAASRLREAIDELDVESLSEEIPESLERSLSGLGQIRRILSAMKCFSHPDEEALVDTDLNQAIESTLVISRNEWKYVAEVEAELADGLPRVPCRAGSINQVLLNLIVNAAHAVEERWSIDPAELYEGEPQLGRIRVSSRLEDDCVEIRIEDDGTGIPEKARARVFDPFFTTKEVGKGTGQGLALSHSIVVEQHGGELRFETEVGVGTSFILRLPLVAAAAEAAKPPAVGRKQDPWPEESATLVGATEEQP